MSFILACSDTGCRDPGGLLFSLADSTRNTLAAVSGVLVAISFLAWIGFPRGSRAGAWAMGALVATVVVGGGTLLQSQLDV